MLPPEFYLYMEGVMEQKELNRDNTRLIMWSILQKGSKKRIKPSDIMQLSMDVKRKGIEKFDVTEYIDNKSKIEAWLQTNRN